MNKKELISAIADHAGVSKADSARSVDAFVDVVKTALGRGDEVRVVGFGTFLAANRAASQGRNPRTGEKINIPACRVPKFKAGKELKRSVN